MFPRKLLGRLFIHCAAAGVGILAYSLAVLFANAVGDFLTNHPPSAKNLQSLSVITVPVGAALGSFGSSIFISLREDEYEVADRNCWSCGILSSCALFVLVPAMLLVNWNKGAGIALRDCFLFFLGWGSPLPTGAALLFFRSSARWR